MRSEGMYKFRFDVFGFKNDVASPVVNYVSNTFTVYSAKRFPGMTNSTELSKIFSEQGLKIRIRKDMRARKSIRAGSDRKRSHVVLSEPSTSLEIDIEQDEAICSKPTRHANSPTVGSRSEAHRRSASPKANIDRWHRRHDYIHDEPHGNASVDDRLYSQHRVSLIDPDRSSLPPT